MSYQSMNDVPKHVLAAMSKAERRRIEIILEGPKLGHPWITTHRQIEVKAGDRHTQTHVAGYFPPEALDDLEQFAKRHWRAEPEKASIGDSTVGNRVKDYYPRLFSNLRCRLTALFEIPECRVWQEKFEQLEAAYLFDLTAADRLARNLEGNERKNRLHDDYRLAFGNIYDELRSLLLELVAIGEMMQRR